MKQALIDVIGEYVPDSNGLDVPFILSVLLIIAVFPVFLNIIRGLFK